MLVQGENNGALGLPRSESNYENVKLHWGGLRNLHLAEISDSMNARLHVKSLARWLSVRGECSSEQQ